MYEVTIIHDLEDLEGELTREEIIRVETDWMDQLDRDYGVTITNVRVDVKEHPRERVSDEPSQEDVDRFEGDREWARANMVDEPQVTHPWDQGLWIFPEDHPMRNVEEVIRNSQHLKMQHHGQRHRAMLELEAVRQKELNP